MEKYKISYSNLSFGINNLRKACQRKLGNWTNKQRKQKLQSDKNLIMQNRNKSL